METLRTEQVLRAHGCDWERHSGPFGKFEENNKEEKILSSSWPYIGKETAGFRSPYAK